MKTQILSWAVALAIFTLALFGRCSYGDHHNPVPNHPLVRQFQSADRAQTREAIRVAMGSPHEVLNGGATWIYRQGKCWSRIQFSEDDRRESSWVTCEY